MATSIGCRKKLFGLCKNFLCKNKMKYNVVRRSAAPRLRVPKRKVNFRRSSTALKRRRIVTAAAIARGARPLTVRSTYPKVYRRRVGAVGLKTSRRKYVRENKSTENQVISLKMGARPITALQLARSAMSADWFRVQGVTQYDTTAGYYPLSSRNLSAAYNTAVTVVPMHVWELTAVPNVNGSGTFQQPNVGWSVGWDSVGGTGNVVMNSLSSQAATGSTLVGSSIIQLENVAAPAGVAGTVQYRKSFHEWTNIKLNLYGVRQRATRYNVSVIMFRDADATDPLAGVANTSSSIVVTNQKCRDLMDYMAKPFIYNNILLGDVQPRQYVKVLKSYDVTIDPITTDEYGGSSAVPHIQTVNWFMRHNRERRYDWLDTGGQSAILPTANYEQNINGVQCRVDPKVRVYLVLRAMSPTFGSNAFTDVPDPTTEPSYDLVMRHKFLHPI